MDFKVNETKDFVKYLDEHKIESDSNREPPMAEQIQKCDEITQE
jgi:hypothetical protein